MTTDFSGLFTPFHLGKFTLPNRFMFPPMGLEVCEGGVPSDDAAEYYARRAQGGASLVITEGVYIDHPSSGDNPLLGRFHGEDAFEGWRNVAAKVHARGGICVPELWHVGASGRWLGFWVPCSNPAPHPHPARPAGASPSH